MSLANSNCYPHTSVLRPVAKGLIRSVISTDTHVHTYIHTHTHMCVCVHLLSSINSEAFDSDLIEDHKHMFLRYYIHSADV